MASLANKEVSNIDVDWLYRGKKKSKRSLSVSGKEKTKEKPPAEAKQASPRLQQSPKLQSDAPPKQAEQEQKQPQETLKQHPPAQQQHIPQQKKQVVPPANAPISKSRAASVSQITPVPSPPTSNPTPNEHATGRSLLSKALRPRSNSDTGKRGPPPISSHNQHANNLSIPTPNSQPLSRSNSLNEKSSSLPSTSAQQAAKPKKTSSLFSVFSKKNRSAPTSPQVTPIQIPSKTNSSLQQSPLTLASSIESLSPSNHELLGKSHFPQNNNQDRIVLNKNPNRSSVPIKELSNVRLRRVTFSLDKLVDDPPQQIPSRRPKKGNVIVLDDIKSVPLKLSVGITNETKVETKSYDEKELKAVKEAQRRALEEAEKHAQEAHIAAQRIAREVLNYKNKANKNKLHKLDSQDPDEEEEKIINEVSNLEIDKPIHLHEHHFEDEIIHTNGDPTEEHEVSLEHIYTRCCHLREILPIPATLKQLKNKTSPLQTLKLLNPKPTLIDVYSFSDFIAIVPIKYLIFDNVTMTSEMLKIILSSLVRSTSIEKLSLRNVPIDQEGWRYLCKFLSRNKSITKLDISQQKIKPDLPLSQHRSEMDWSLFIDTLILRNGIEELILNGCKLATQIFGRLIEEGVSKSTKRLGVSQMDLSLEHIKILSSWISSTNCVCEGLDIGYNDLSKGEKLKPLIKKVAYADTLQSISINSTSLTNVEDVALLVRSLSKLPNLRFLDLSNLSPIFPGILPYLNKYLPRFPNLNRLHLDNNELSTKSFSILSEIIPKCEKLVHVSITGNQTMSKAAAASLYSGVKSSKSLMECDFDYELIDEEISSRIAVCLMRNMDKISRNHDNGSITSLTSSGESYDDILFDGSLIAETASKLLDKLSTNDLEKDEFSKKFLKRQFLDKISKSRENINKTMDELLHKRDHDQLTLEEKEDLLRFYFLDTSLAKILEIFENLPDDDSNTNVSAGNQATSQRPGSLPALLQPDTIPHQMAIDVDHGKETPIDVATGRPIYLRSLSQTSVQAKKQEEEEGEFHRWGFFVQQQRQMFPVDVPNTIHEVPSNSQQSTNETPVEVNQLQNNNNNDTIPVAANQSSNTFVVPKLPSGTELRDAVIKAKGIESITNLIDSVNHNRFSLKNIYPEIKEAATTVGSEDESFESHDELSDHDQHIDMKTEDIQEVEIAYDNLLNELSRVRSNK